MSDVTAAKNGWAKITLALLTVTRKRRPSGCHNKPEKPLFDEVDIPILVACSGRAIGYLSERKRDFA